MLLVPNHSNLTNTLATSLKTSSPSHNLSFYSFHIVANFKFLLPSIPLLIQLTSLTINNIVP